MFDIRIIGDKILTQKAKRVTKIDDTIRTLCASMTNTMIKNNGIGLSANQIGILKRIIIVLNKETIITMINPEIIDFSEKTCNLKEGCLSIPNTYISINRPETVTVKYRDTRGKPHLETYSGLTSRVIQHEIEHLDGILMTKNINN